jgi:3-hydroxyacyl-CoA dehydrogenase
MKLEDIKTVGLAGMGVMGRGISISALLAGYKPKMIWSMVVLV